MTTITGTSGNDTLIGTIGADIISGLDGNDSISGGAGADTIFGGDGNDTVQSGEGRDTIDLGAGDDVLIWDEANGDYDLFESIDGGTGNDTLQVIGYGFFGITLNLQAGTFGYTKVDNFENYSHTGGGDYTIIGSFAANIITVNAGNQVIEGRAGDDTISAGAGDDDIDGGEGADNLDGGTGVDTLRYLNSDGRVFVDLGAQTATGGHATGDTIANFENVIGSRYADTLTGDSGNNTITGGGGADILDGGEGVDTLSYITSIGSVTVNLEAQTATGGHAYFNTIANFENVIGSIWADTLIGSSGSNTINGKGGNDTIYAGKGNDIVYGGSGDDIILGIKGHNELYGEAGNDTVNTGDHTSTVDAGAGDDLIVARMKKGADHMLTGGAGADTFEFVYQNAKKAADVTITDFELGVDQFVIGGLSAEAWVDINFALAGALDPDILSEVNGNAVLEIGLSDTITFEGISEADFTSYYLDEMIAIG